MTPAVAVLWQWLQDPSALAPLPAHCRAGSIRISCVDDGSSVAVALAHAGTRPVAIDADVDCTWFTDSHQLTQLLSGTKPFAAPLRVEGDTGLLTSLAEVLRPAQSAYATRLRAPQS